MVKLQAVFVTAGYNYIQHTVNQQSVLTLHVLPVSCCRTGENLLIQQQFLSNSSKALVSCQLSYI